MNNKIFSSKSVQTSLNILKHKKHIWLMNCEAVFAPLRLSNSAVTLRDAFDNEGKNSE